MLQTNIQQLLAPLITSLGYELWGCEYHNAGKHSLLRIYIDRADGVVSINDCEIVSKHVGSILDVEDIIHGEYNLEISSPGIPRPLFTIAQYSRYIGHQIQVHLYSKINGQKKLRGKIIAATNETVVLDIDETSFEIQFPQI